jgi:hypothetical protein
MEEDCSGRIWSCRFWVYEEEEEEDMVDRLLRYYRIARCVGGEEMLWSDFEWIGK